MTPYTTGMNKKHTTLIKVYIGDGVVLTDRKGEKLLGKVRKCIKYDDTITKYVHCHSMNDKYVHGVYYHDGTTEHMKANIIAENILSQVDSEGNHYKLLT